MSRRTVELAGQIVAVVALLLILANATLVDRVPPNVKAITLGRPTGDDHVGLTHTTIDVEFTKAVDHASAELHFHLVPEVQGTFSWDGTRTMIFTPATKLPVATRFTVTMSPGYRDPSGNVADQGVGSWTFTTVGLPILSSSTPAAGAVDVPVDAGITLTFDRLMDVGATQAAISLMPATRFTATWSGSTVKLTPVTPLAFGTRYVITVSDQAADTDGNSPDGPISVDFTTVSAGLNVVRVIPADGSAGAPVDGPIAMSFDGPVDPTSVRGLVRVTPAAPGELRVETAPDDVPGDAPSATVLVYKPASPLAAHTTYTVELLDGVKSADDPRKVAPGRSWTFTTGAPTDSLQNQVLFLSARTGIRNLWAMNPDGSNPRQLTDELAPVTAYDATADGKRIVFAAGGLVKTLRLGDTVATVLTPDDAFDYAPRLLPDGSAVLLGRRGRIGGADLGIWLVSVDPGQAPKQLLPVGAPPTGSIDAPDAVAAGGRPGPWDSVAAVSADGGTALVEGAAEDVVRLDLAAGTATGTGLHDLRGPIQWSDRRKGFVVEAVRDGDASAGAWLVRPGQPLEALVGGGDWLTESSRGDLAWLGAMVPSHLTFEASGAGGVSTLTAAPDLSDREPAFSPAGDMVVFVRVEREGGAGLGIWVVRTDGRELGQLSPDGSSPRWLP